MITSFRWLVSSFPPTSSLRTALRTLLPAKRQIEKSYTKTHQNLKYLALDVWDKVGEAESRVNDQATSFLGHLFPVLLETKGCLSVVAGVLETLRQQALEFSPDSRRGQVHGS